jgi:tripartite-type tricarboxylate transporter receptor subunit TctC
MARLALALIAVILTAPAWAQTRAWAQTPAEFYRGKQVSIYVGFSAGGTYDIYARTLARHIGKHIPGNPSVVPRNMEGAGSLRLANYIHQVAPRDGTAIATIGRATVAAPLFGVAAAKFDPREFSWLGSANDEVSICAAWSESGIKQFDDLKTKEYSFGATGPTEEAVQIYKTMNALLGTKIRTVSGYPGGTQINLAMERGEIHGRCALSWSSVKATLQHWLDEKKLRPMLQVASAKHADLPDVPLLMDLAPDDEARYVFRFLVARQVIGRPFFGSPAVPADRAAALRKAFIDTLNDKEFLAEAVKAKLEINPVPAERIEELLRELYAVPADITKKAAVLFN